LYLAILAILFANTSTDGDLPNTADTKIASSAVETNKIAAARFLPKY
jgi:hypothetical protein